MRVNAFNGVRGSGFLFQRETRYDSTKEFSVIWRRIGDNGKNVDAVLPVPPRVCHRTQSVSVMR
jgi:hypothetical protein